jgi:ABC-type Zn uptake system ZnuABC Zn-binding protein ZnuA
VASGAVDHAVKLLMARDIRVVFPEYGISSDELEEVVRRCRNRGHEVTMARPLYTASLGPADSPQSQYQQAMQDNMRTIVEAIK